jgi:hypothetical protein
MSVAEDKVMHFGRYLRIEQLAARRAHDRRYGGMADAPFNGDGKELFNNRVDVSNCNQTVLSFELCRQDRRCKQHTSSLAAKRERQRAVVELSYHAR